MPAWYGWEKLYLVAYYISVELVNLLGSGTFDKLCFYGEGKFVRSQNLSVQLLV
jgi:hypothetical protein